VSPIEAGKQVLTTAESYLKKAVSFSVETTLSGSTYLKMLAEAKKLGFDTCLFYIGTQDLSINLARVKLRVIAGGHDVPIETRLGAMGEASRIFGRRWLWSTRQCCWITPPNWVIGSWH